MKKKREESSRRGSRRFEQAGPPSPAIDESLPLDLNEEGIDAEVTDEDDELFGEGAQQRQFLIKRNVRRRVDVYLLDRLKGISRNRIQKLIALGGVKVNEKTPKASTVILKGDVIDVILPAPAIRTIEPEDIPLHVLYEDEHFIVVNKQAGLIVHPARSHKAGTLLNALAHHFMQQRVAIGQAFRSHSSRGFREPTRGSGAPEWDRKNAGKLKRDAAKAAKESADVDVNADDVVSEEILDPKAITPGTLSSASPGSKEYDGPPVTIDGLSEVGAAECRPGIIHRLDRYTTGVMVVAKNDESHWGIASQFEDRTTTKAYLALVHGNFDNPAFVIDEPLGKHPTIREAYAVRRDALSKASVTICRVREQYQGYSLVELELKTGRTHQIRVHMGYMGHPIMGDIIYGGEPIGEAELITPPQPAGGRKLQTYARSREDGQRMEAKAAARADIILYTPALHAGLLSFVHPSTRQVVRFTAPLHQPMRDLVQRLRSMPHPGPLATAGTMIDLAAAIPL